MATTTWHFSDMIIGRDIVPYGTQQIAQRHDTVIIRRVTILDEDPFSDSVELQDVIDAAKRLNKQRDKNWS